jgi:hypothetical protein
MDLRAPQPIGGEINIYKRAVSVRVRKVACEASHRVHLKGHSLPKFRGLSVHLLNRRNMVPSRDFNFLHPLQIILRLLFLHLQYYPNNEV